MRVGVEVGGTFTDLVVVDESGAICESRKVFSTPAQPELAVLEALNAVKTSVPDRTPLMHGSTVATNAMIERTAPTAGLLVTKGFRDILELQRQDRETLYNLQYVKPQPLAPRNAVREVPERIASDGRVLHRLDEDAVRTAVLELVATGVEAIAVCLLHSYQNPLHERRVGEIIAEVAPGAQFSLSCEVTAEFREYERATTTTVDAYVKPVVARYLDRFEGNKQMSGGLWVMQSNGGIVPSAYTRERPVQMLYSGPSAGVVGASTVAVGIDDIITVDMGGTSTDVCLISQKQPEVTVDAMLDQLPIRTPMFDIQTVGAGGGSIAWIDSGGMLRVGPKSAGAKPGPICYGRGGDLPTTTDANVVRGIIQPDRFLGGHLTLEREKAASVLEEFGARLGRSGSLVAQDIFDVANAAMANAIRLVSVERGHDVREYTIVAYGGAGPLHAAAVADHLNLPRVLVPASPALISAYGLLVADVQLDFSRTNVVGLDLLSSEQILETFDGLRTDAITEVVEHSIAVDAIHLHYGLDMRYRGQGFELTIPINPESDLSNGTGVLSSRFHELHQMRYGHATTGEAIEVVTYRLSILRPSEKPLVPCTTPSETRPARTTPISIDGEEVPCTFLWRGSLESGFTMEGPAVVEENTSTTFVPPGWRCVVDEFTNLILDRR